MKYNKQEILSKIKKANIVTNFLNEEDSEDIADSLSIFFPNAKFYSGATKFVIAPKNKNYVLKIPFKGYYYSPIEDENFLEESFTPFVGAGEKNSWNYCDLEIQRYKKAKRCNLHFSFAETRLVGNIDNNFPVYIQKKCITLQDGWFQFRPKTQFAEKFKTKLADKAFTYNLPLLLNIPIDSGWLLSYYTHYGMNKLISFLYFLKDNNMLEDLRPVNIGYTYDKFKPVLIDYAGYAD